MLKKLANLPRVYKRLIMVSSDAVMVVLSLWAALALRYGDVFALRGDALWLFILMPLVAVAIFVSFGLYRAVLRYLGPQAVWAVLKAVGLTTLALAALVFLGRVQGFPRSSLILFGLVALLLVGGSRFFARYLFQSLTVRRQQRQRVAIYGAGFAGVQLSSALANSAEYRPVAFLDDDERLRGIEINGLPVYAPEDLPNVIPKLDMAVILLALPSLSPSQRRAIVNKLEPLKIRVKTLPGMADLVSGRARLDEFRELDIEDLLGRDPVAPNKQLLGRCVTGKAVLVTGAGGSIGSELCRQIAKLQPTRLVLLEQSEFALYAIEKEARALAARNDWSFEIVALLGSVLHRWRMRRVMEAYRIDTVYHAAAYKHVPIVEHNSLEGIQNNVFGTWHTAEAAYEAGVETFVLVSTDKAVRPTNVMGASKRLAELVLQGLNQRGGHTHFCMVRFGNVLGSSGSVVPLFRDQIKPGGVVTVTHPEVTRYFMTIPEAASLVIQAGSMGHGGDVFVLDMGEPVKIVDMARRMIHLMGFEVRDEQHPEGDVTIQFTGLRPGEKLYEELLIGENVIATDHPMIMRAQERALSWVEVEQMLAELDAACRNFDCALAARVLHEQVDGYTPESEIQDLVWSAREKPALKVVSHPTPPDSRSSQ